MMICFSGRSAFIALAAMTLATPAAAALTVSPLVGHPKIPAMVSGTGFAAKEAVDIYFDTADKVLTVTNASGAFANIPLAIPADAPPGMHWITAIGRKDGVAYQASFNVRTDWTQFRFTGNGRRYNPYENVLNASNVTGLDTLWVKKTGAQILSSPVVAGGRLFIGSDDKRLYALDPATGAVLWTALTGGPIECAAAVSGGKVYVNSYDGELYAFNAATGAKLWNSAAIVDGDSSPTVANGLVYVGGYNEHDLLAFNAATGAIVWSFPVDNVIDGSPAYANGAVYAGTLTGSIYAWDATTGALLWSDGGSEAMYSPPVVYGGVVYVGNDGPGFFQLSATNGAIINSETPAGDIRGAAAAANGFVFVGDRGDHLTAYDAKATGNFVWQATLPGPTDSSPAIANGVVFVGAGYNLSAYDAIYGTLLWTNLTGGQVASPAVVNGTVYAASQDGKIYAYALDGGQHPAYKTNRPPPSYASLHPDRRLKPLK